MRIEVRLLEVRQGSFRYFLSLVVMTTADETSADLRIAADRLSDELRVPAQVVLRKEMLEILAKGLIKKKFEPEEVSP